MSRKKPKQTPKRVLRLPDLDFAKSVQVSPLRICSLDIRAVASSSCRCSAASYKGGWSRFPGRRSSTTRGFAASFGEFRCRVSPGPSEAPSADPVVPGSRSNGSRSQQGTRASIQTGTPAFHGHSRKPRSQTVRRQTSGPHTYRKLRTTTPRRTAIRLDACCRTVGNNFLSASSLRVLVPCQTSRLRAPSSYSSTAKQAWPGQGQAGRNGRKTITHLQSRA